LQKCDIMEKSADAKTDIPQPAHEEKIDPYLRKKRGGLKKRGTTK